jgi:tetratricopeptide (TPR) repeat protein
MKLKLMSKLTAMIILLGFAVIANAQTATEAVDALKDGVAKSQSKDYLGAIVSFKKCIEIYDAIEESDNDNAVTAATQIPSMQYKYALTFYKKKQYDESIVEFENLIQYSQEYNDVKYEKKAKATIPKLYYAKGAGLLKSKDYAGAITALDKSIEMNPKYPMAYVRKAQVYKEQEDETNFKTSIDQAITASVAKKDAKTEGTAKKLASTYYFNAGAMAVKSEKYADAETYFNTLMDYKAADSDVYYQLASIYNKQSKWDAGIEAANKAIELFKDAGTTKDAKIYFELGNSYVGKGDNAAACDAYTKANKGDYAEAAAYQMKHVVKCK